MEENNLDTLLKAWNHTRVHVARDVNCLFVSVAHSLKMQLERGNADLERILNT